PFCDPHETPVLRLARRLTIRGTLGQPRFPASTAKLLRHGVRALFIIRQSPPGSGPRGRQHDAHSNCHGIMRVKSGEPPAKDRSVKLNPMRSESLEFLKTLVDTPSPSGYEEKAAEVYRQYTKPFADKIHTDVHGSVWAILNPKAEMKIMLSGHMDEIGFIVHYIDDKGLLYFRG